MESKRILKLLNKEYKFIQLIEDFSLKKLYTEAKNNKYITSEEGLKRIRIYLGNIPDLVVRFKAYKDDEGYSVVRLIRLIEACPRVEYWEAEINGRIEKIFIDRH